MKKLTNILLDSVTWIFVFVICLLIWSHIIVTYKLSEIQIQIGGFCLGFFVIPIISRRLNKLTMRSEKSEE